MKQWPKLAPLMLVTASALLAGCASTAIDQNRQFTDAYATKNVGAPAKWHTNNQDQTDARARAATMLESPLSADDAVRLALDLSPAFQALQSDAAARSAAATQSGRLANPLFTFERLMRREHGGVDIDIGRVLSISLIELFYLPNRLNTAEMMQTQARLQSATSVVETAANVRHAWVRAVAAQQSVIYTTQVMEAADASAELARRMFTVGNFSKLQHARQQAFYADAFSQLTRAKQIQVATREALIRQLGLDATLAQKLTLPARLPDLPAKPKSEMMIAQTSMDQRLDVQMAKAELDLIAGKNGLTRVTSYVNAFHAARVNNSETGKPPQRGYELELAIPIFDWGDAQRSRAHAEYLVAAQRLTQTGIDAESAIRVHYAEWRAAYELSNHYRTEIVPLRKVIAEEMLLKYNGMLIGVFDLLAETRAQIGSVILSIDAQRDFWLADATLQATMLGKPIGGGGGGGESAMAERKGESAAAGPGH